MRSGLQSKGRLGAALLGLPKDVGLAEINADPAAGWGQQFRQGPSHPQDLRTAADIFKDLKHLLLLLGMQASDRCISEALQTYVQRRKWHSILRHIPGSGMPG